MPDASTVTEATEAVAVEQVASGKKPRSAAQLAALEAARKKAIASRSEMATERKLEKIETTLQQIRKPKPPPTPAPVPVVESVDESPPPADEAEEPEEEVHYVRKAKAAPKKPKKRIVVVEESDKSDEEIEVRLPPRRNKPKASAPAPLEPSAEELRYQRTVRDLFTII